ncbi:hypothetical protein [Conchiformibius kuhniae]|uniref:Lipoprotein n=1 Tax=Conchiformibius kuhniae TaxID=211502 RepID=A0A8T9MSQ2_9NEIS|nr:hypothetical protein [Conchiformibius kuhniae]
MNKIALTALTALALTACAAPNGSAGFGNVGGADIGAAGSGLVKMWVQNQCVGELQKRNEWRLIALAMSAEKQQEWEDRICGCASEEAPKQISAADIGQMLTQEGRNKVAAEVTVKTVTACFKRLYQK